MSYEIRVAETDHGDGFGPDPTVTLIVSGSHDVSRLVHLLSKSGNREQGRVLDEVVEKLRANPGGLDTLRMLRAHGGNDYTGEVFQQWAVQHPEVLLSVHTSRNAALYTLSKLPGGVLVTRMSNEDDDAWAPETVPAVVDVELPEPAEAVHGD